MRTIVADSPRPAIARLIGRSIALAIAISAGAGCGYTLRAPYDKEIRTVYVPIFRSYSFRPDMNLQLTRAIQAEINRRTPYRVVDRIEEADTILSGTVLFTTKNLLVVNPYNFPRNVTAEMTVEASWEDLRTVRDTKLPQPKIRVMDYVNFYDEVGETANLGYERTIQKIAKGIVSMMEEPW